ncbi:MAG: substrate-binding domain-containing protein [Bacteroidales bacterium]|nr:substrate-binding domain-containing protein [Bacteroidales bacterium]
MANKNIKPSLTIKEIARLAGVSPGTVDRVIHKRSEVSPDTHDRIMKIIEEFGYQPNLLARSLATKKTFKIAFIRPKHTKSNPYWLQSMEGINKAVAEFGPFGFNLLNFEFDSTDEQSFKEISRQALENNPDGVILVPFFIKESHLFLDECEKSDIPYCFLDSCLKDRNYLSFVGQDGFRSGYVAAKLMNYMLPDPAKVLIVNISSSFGNTNMLYQRVQGFRQFFESDPKHKTIEIFQREIPDSSDPNQINFDKGIIEELGIQGVYIPNSRSYIVAQLLEKHHLDNLPVIGYDLIPQNIKLLEKRYIDFLIGQRPQKQAFKVVATLFEHLVLKKEVIRDNFSPIDIITRENLNYYSKSLEG